MTPFDWFNSRIVVDFKVNILASGADLAADDPNGIVNGSHALINNFKVNLNGKKVYDCNDANHVVNIKNLLEYSPIYAETTATNKFFYLDTLKKDPHKPIIIRVLLQEKLFWVHQVQSILKYLSIDTVFSMHYKMNFFQIRV